MSEYPISNKIVKSLRYRDELNRILNTTGKPTNGERLFLACFLKDQCGWEETAISLLICEKAKWSDLDPATTNRNVDRIFVRHTKYQSSRATRYPNGTTRRETQQGAEVFKNEVETGRCCDQTTTTLKKTSVTIGFQVSTGYRDPEQETNMEQQKQAPVTIRTVVNIHNGSKFYRIAEKEGQYGSFYSLESGWINDAEYEGKQIKVSGRPEKFFSLPAEPDTLKQLIAGLQQLLPAEEPVKQKKK